MVMLGCGVDEGQMVMVILHDQLDWFLESLRRHTSGKSVRTFL